MQAITSSDLAGIGDPVIIFTCGRSGTHMTIDLIRRHFAGFASWKYPLEYNSAVYTWLDSLVQPGASLRSLGRLRRAARPILMTHFWPKMCEHLARDQPVLAQWIIERGRVIHVVRNPRDAINSAWPIENHRARRIGRQFETREHYVRRVGRRWATDLEAMRHGSPHIQLRYEDIIRDPAWAIRRIGEWIGAVPLGREPILVRPYRSVTEARLARIFMTRPVSTAAIASRAVRAKYCFAWTPQLNAILLAAVGSELALLGYNEETAFHQSTNDRSVYRAGSRPPAEFATGEQYSAR